MGRKRSLAKWGPNHYDFNKGYNNSGHYKFGRAGDRLWPTCPECKGRVVEYHDEYELYQDSDQWIQCLRLYCSQCGLELRTARSIPWEQWELEGSLGRIDHYTREGHVRDTPCILSELTRIHKKTMEANIYEWNGQQITYNWQTGEWIENNFRIKALQMLPFARLIFNGVQDDSEKASITCLPEAVKMHLIGDLSNATDVLTYEQIRNIGLFAAKKETIGRSKKEFLKETGCYEYRKPQIKSPGCGAVL